jgi:hypothetical protein
MYKLQSQFWRVFLLNGNMTYINDSDPILVALAQRQDEVDDVEDVHDDAHGSVSDEDAP